MGGLLNGHGLHAASTESEDQSRSQQHSTGHVGFSMCMASLQAGPLSMGTASLQAVLFSMGKHCPRNQRRNGASGDHAVHEAAHCILYALLLSTMPFKHSQRMVQKIELYLLSVEGAYCGQYYKRPGHNY